MKKLLSANFSRMRKSRIFWVLAAFCFLVGAFAYGLAAYNVRVLGLGWMEFNAHAYFYMQILYIGAVIAVFSSFFLGTEYTDGTIRNKLLVGHDRVSVYLSNMVTIVAAGFLFQLAYLLAVMLVGIPFAGVESITCVELQSWRLICCLLVTVEYGALFTMIPMLDAQKARGVLISLVVAGIVILFGMLIYGRLSQPEFETMAWVQADGSYILKEGMPNSKYLTGRIRTVFEWINAWIPSGSVLISLDRNYAFDPRYPMCTIVGTGLITVLGTALFRRKDLK